jgi:hypothetical protein
LEDLVEACSTIGKVYTTLLDTSNDPGKTFILNRIDEVLQAAYPFLENKRALQRKLNQNSSSVFWHVRTGYWRHVRLVVKYSTPTPPQLGGDVIKKIMVITIHCNCY